MKTANASIEFIEKSVKAMCALYPIEAAKETCDKIIDEVDQIVQLIEKDVEPTQICQEMKLCSNTSTSSLNPHHMRRLYSPRKCGAMCKHLKMVNGIGFDVQMEKLENTREMLNGFCKENKISTKCKYIQHLMNKTEAEFEMIFALENEAYCECDKRAPWAFFMHRRGNSMCDTCKKFEAGMIKDLEEAHQTVNMLLDEMNEICSAFPDPIKEKCSTIAAEIKAFTEYLEKKLDPSGVCVAMGVCHEHKHKPIMEKFEERVSSILKPGGIFDILKPWGSRGRGRPNKNETECVFCKDCLKEVTPDAESKGKDFVKKTLSMVCESKSNGTDISTVCKKMVDGVETVDKIHRKLTASFKMPKLCDLLDIC